MGFLQDQCSFGFYNHEKADTSKPFRCGETRSATSLSTCAGGFNYLFSTEEQEREFRGIKPERPLNSRLMYFDLIELIKKK